MEVLIAEIHGEPVKLSLDNGLVSLNGEPMAIKGVTEADLQAFLEELANLPQGDSSGHTALVNSVRAAFIAKLLSHAVGDECVDELSHILGHVHDEVMEYLEK